MKRKRYTEPQIVFALQQALPSNEEKRNLVSGLASAMTVGPEKGGSR